MPTRYLRYVACGGQRQCLRGVTEPQTWAECGGSLEAHNLRIRCQLALGTALLTRT